MAVPNEVVFANARLVGEDAVRPGWLAVRDGWILDMGSRSAPGPALDCEGDFLMPGLVELHTDHLERELNPRRGVAWPAMSALLSHDAKLTACGITTVLDAVAVGDTFDRVERSEMLSAAVRAIEDASAAHLLRADHFLHLRCEVADPRLMAIYDRLGDGARVRLVSLMDHTPGARQYADVARYRAYLQSERRLSAPEAEAFITERQALSRAHADDNRKAIAARARERAIVLATHDDAEAAHIEEALALGATIAEFPTTRQAAAAARAGGRSTVLGAPNIVRGGSHNGNVAAAELAGEGLIDALSSDYMPVSLLGAPFGLAHAGTLPLEQAIALVTCRPAAMIGLDDRGRLRAGLRADLVRVHDHGGTPVVRGVWRQGVRVA
jgi:alpha-D-ribose 1-methylphosphonate 5-triphosphate diphosphatase